jgi:hypothetical protein
VTAPTPACSNPTHKGHKHYTGGGSMDGQVTATTAATPSDFPMTIGTVLRGGTRSWYEIDYDASEGTEVVYRFIGYGKEFPQREVTE